MASPEAEVEVSQVDVGLRGGSHFRPGVTGIPEHPTPVEGLTTVTEVILHSIRTNADLPAIKYRRLLRFHPRVIRGPDGVQTEEQIPEFEPPTVLTYAEYGSLLFAHARGFRDLLGLTPDVPLDSPERRIAFCMSSRYEYVLMENALWLSRCLVIPISEYLGPNDEITHHILNSTSARTIVTELRFLGDFCVLKETGTLPEVTRIVVCGCDDPSQLAHFESIEGLTVCAAQDVPKSGEELPEQPSDRDWLTIPDGRVVATDPILLVHTSGTTGMPKGVVVKHENLLPACYSCALSCSMGTEDRLVGYLPLFHVMGQMIDNTSLMFGACTCYAYSSKTLTDVRAIPCGAFTCYRPTLFLTVPRLLDTIRKKVLFKVSQSSWLKQKLFRWAFDSKRQGIYTNTGSPFWDWLVFGKFKALFGGQLRFIASGAAPLSRETMEFVQTLLHPALVVQVYGATETCGGGCVRTQDDPFQTLNVGPPNIFNEVKLVDVPEINLIVDEGEVETGELWIRGPSVCLEYFQNPEATEAAFTPDGWYKTGDIAVRHPDGAFSITDRKSCFLKLSNGEFVSPEALQMQYGSSPFVSPNGICVLASSLHSVIVAIVVPDFDYVNWWAGEEGLAGEETTLAEFCAMPQLKEAILGDLERVAQEQGLRRFEIVRDVVLFPETFSTENGLAGGTMKILRGPMRERFAEEVAEMYGRLD